MVDSENLIQDRFSEYILKTFPGFYSGSDEVIKRFYNDFCGFSINTYCGKLTEGIELSALRLDKGRILPSVSAIGLYTGNEENLFHNYLINNFLLEKFIANLSARAEVEKIRPIMRRADLSDLFSGRTLAATIANNCPNGFTLQNCPSGIQTIRGVLLDNNVDGKVLDYLCDRKLI